MKDTTKVSIEELKFFKHHPFHPFPPIPNFVLAAFETAANIFFECSTNPNIDINRKSTITSIISRTKKFIKMQQSKVSFTAYYTINGVKYFNEPFQGIFQRWADSVKYEGEKAFPVTIAIILGDDGVVYTVPPDHIVETK